MEDKLLKAIEKKIQEEEQAVVEYMKQQEVHIKLNSLLKSKQDIENQIKINGEDDGKKEELAKIESEIKQVKADRDKMLITEMKKRISMRMKDLEVAKELFSRINVINASIIRLKEEIEESQKLKKELEGKVKKLEENGGDKEQIEGLNKNLEGINKDLVSNEMLLKSKEEDLKNHQSVLNNLFLKYEIEIEQEKATRKEFAKIKDEDIVIEDLDHEQPENESDFQYVSISQREKTKEKQPEVQREQSYDEFKFEDLEQNEERKTKRKKERKFK